MMFTPSAARAVFEAIYWKSQIRWRVLQIDVLNPISFANIRRCEVAARTFYQKDHIIAADYRQLRNSLVLRDVRYRITAEMEIFTIFLGQGETPEKHYAIFERRASKGQCFTQPYLDSGKIDSARSSYDQSECKARKLIDVNTIKHTDAREIGAENACLQAMRELQLDTFLRYEGWSERKINATLASLIVRTVYSPSEWASLCIIDENSAAKLKHKIHLRGYYKTLCKIRTIENQLDRICQPAFRPKKIPKIIFGVKVGLGISYKLNKKRISHEFGLQILNLTGYTKQYGYQYNEQKKITEKVKVVNMRYLTLFTKFSFK